MNNQNLNYGEFAIITSKAGLNNHKLRGMADSIEEVNSEIIPDYKIRG